MIRDLSVDDCKSIGILHEKAFKNFFLTSLGRPFLIKFYEAILKEGGFGVGAFQQNNMLGFAVGTKDYDGFYRRILKKYALTLGFRALIPIIISPSRLIRLITSLKSSPTALNGGCLLSICVEPTSAGKGLGTRLIEEFEKAFLQDGQYFLTTDAENNAAANQFYRKNGFIQKGVLQQRDRKLNIYIKTL